MNVSSYKSYFYKSAIGLTGVLAGIIFFLWQQGFIVLHIPWHNRLHNVALHKTSSFQRKSIMLYHWKNNKWYETSSTVLWDTQNSAESIKNLVNSWVQSAQDEQLVMHAFWLRHVAVTSLGSELLLSFSQSILVQEWSIAEKILFIEGLLKTIHTVAGDVQKLFFLVHDDYMPDNHLDFSRPWPVEGFIQKDVLLSC